jgi:hypothetical protein
VNKMAELFGQAATQAPCSPVDVSLSQIAKS